MLLLLQSIGMRPLAADVPASVPVVTNISGQAAVHGSNGATRDVVSSQVVRNGDMVVTGFGSLAILTYGDAGTVRLGPGTTTSTSLANNQLALHMSSGSLCVDSQRPVITVQAGQLAVTPVDDNTIFNLSKDSSQTKLAVYRGQIETTFGGKSSTVLKVGQAIISSHNATQDVSIDSVTPSFSALRCPDPEIIARAVPVAQSSQSATSSKGGGGGIIAILLGLGAVAALAGKRTGGGSNSNSVLPSPGPTPGPLLVNPNSFTFAVGDPARSFTASESNYGRTIKAQSANLFVATVSPASGAGPSVNFSVTPVGPGQTTISVTDDHGQSQSVSVRVISIPHP